MKNFIVVINLINKNNFFKSQKISFSDELLKSKNLKIDLLKRIKINRSRKSNNNNLKSLP